jgi:hypothetical protein
VIPDIYLADGVIEAAFLILWIYVGVKKSDGPVSFHHARSAANGETSHP